eukprot:m.42199 g.42199  ORF g.42199 m.42199 type:complete len:206 (+) comp6239_c0_seq1:80-697(+)
MIVPFGHGFKSVKFLQNIRLTNDYRAMDTYAAIANSGSGNDPSSVQKTYTTVDMMHGAPSIPRGTPFDLSGILTCGRTPPSYLEYWVRGPCPDLEKAYPIDCDHPDYMSAQWTRFEIPPAPNMADVLPAGINPSDVFGVNESGVPVRWPLPFSFTPWRISITLDAPGFYEIRARSVDIAGHAQPEPRPYPKSGRNPVQVRRVHIV